MNNFIKYTLLVSLVFVWGRSLAQPAQPAQAAQQAKPKAIQVKGVVLDANKRFPLGGVQIVSPEGRGQALSADGTGAFTLNVNTIKTHINVVKVGYFTQRVDLFGRDSVVVYLQASNNTFATDRYSTSEGEKPMANRNSPATAINRKNISEGYSATSDALTGRFTGLRVLDKSGMPGEGSFINLRGLRSIMGENTPLVVVDGLPYMPDTRSSLVIGGFSSDILEPVNLKEIEQITLLKGADALAYGSMGSNGVLMIETEKGIDNQTVVDLYSTEGVTFIDKTIPLLNATEFRKYIGDIGISQYPDAQELQTYFPFLKNNLSAAEKIKYGNNMDWQNEIYSPGLTSENMLKIKGGDAVVKFLLTAGYISNQGALKGTSQDKFYTRGNTNVVFSDKLTATASVAFDYNELLLQEQGMATPQTNLMLSAYGFSPLNRTHQIEIENGKARQLPGFSQYDPSMGISNPAAMINGIDARNRMYDMMINSNMTYKINPFWRAGIVFGIYYNYIKDDIFIGGRSSLAIAPLLGGQALNTVRSGSSETKNYYGKAWLGYNRSFNYKHNLSVDAAWQVLSARHDASMGAGINTASDRYRNLTKTQNNSRRTDGYSEIWNWMDSYVTANYNFDQQLFVTGAAMVDAASTYGDYSQRFFVFPAAKLGWKINNLPVMRHHAGINNFMLRTEFSVNPNSRYSSKYGKYYYILQMVHTVSGLVRDGIPNRMIGPEKVYNTNLGLDFATRGDKFTVSLDMFQEYTRDMIVPASVSGAYGTNTMFKNAGELRTRGAEANVSLLLSGGKFRWRVGGNISAYKSVILDLGGADQYMVDMEDGVSVINKVGESPYSFYGNTATGVIAGVRQAEEANLKTQSGYTYGPGDIRFVDRNRDGIINNSDRAVLGHANPDFFGGVYSKMSLGGFSLFVNCTYSYGNDIYNGVRRYNESGTRFSNQAASMARRWIAENQITDIPRVMFGDPAGNNSFSSRWIEDGSFFKFKEITLAYETNKKVLFLTGMKVYITGENLFTFTDYTGSDPEFAYSYDMSRIGMDLAKVPVPKLVKLGLVLNF